MAVEFTDPPVNEVVFSVVFETKVFDEVRALSDFRPLVREEFPELEKLPPVLRADEKFSTESQLQEPAITFRAVAPDLRYWFVGTDPTRVIQVQDDRFSFNWRVVEDDDYPGFTTIFPEFHRHFETFSGLLKGAPRVAWCELTYINPIHVEANEDGSHGQLSRVMEFLGQDPNRVHLPDVEDTTLQQRFRLVPEGETEPTGRLIVTAQPAVGADMELAYVLTLLARIRPPSQSWEDLDATFRWAHDLIVHGFKEITRKELHEEWGEVTHD